MNLRILHDTFVALGLQGNDTVLVASDIRRIIIRSKLQGTIIDPLALIHMLQELVGSEGTLLFPVYNWDFCKGKPFDYLLTPGKTGTLGNVALRSSAFRRTRHPIYSFSVWGKYANFLYSLTNRDSFAQDSPFSFLHKNKAKMLLLDVACQNSLTFVHYVEQAHRVPYRFLKSFTAQYIDENRNGSEQIYSMYVRDLSKNVVTDLTGLERLLIRRKNLVFIKVGEVNLGCIQNMAETYGIISHDIQCNNALNLHSIATSF